MMELSIEEIVAVCGSDEGLGTRVVASADADLSRRMSVLLTDSRSLTVADRTVFFAIMTRGNDGHKYVGELYDRGVRVFVVNRLPADVGRMGEGVWIVVDDTVRALQCVGSLHREGRMVAITGSRGKTMLKEWIFQLMESLAETVRSPRSYNSQIGVPLSLWETGDDTELAVIETGISESGEMARLAEIIRPETVIFTNVLGNHDAGFESREEKASEKALLAAPESVRTLIFNADNVLLRDALAPYLEGRKVLSWSAEGNVDAALRVRKVGEVRMGRERLEYEYGDMVGVVSYPAMGEWSMENAANALAFMLSCGYDAELIGRRFESLTPIGTRLNVSEGVNSCSLVYDSYTSDFSSLVPALDFMRRRAMAGQSRTLILSDLRHEPRGGGDVYRAIAEEVGRSGISRFIGVGRQLKAHRDLFPKSSLFFETTDEMLGALEASDFSDEIILLKGSPEYEFFRIYESLEARTHETVLEVNLGAVVKNFNWFRSRLPSSTGLIAMVKASGYGAGSFEIAKTLQDAGASYLAVAVLDEGIELRRRGISMPIMVMNPRVVNYRSMFSNRLEPEIYTGEMLEDVIRAARRAGIRRYPIHVKLDTGMHRMGFVEDELPGLMDRLGSQDYVEARSVFSHLATADLPEMDEYTYGQLERFERFTDYMLSRSTRPFLRHILNTAGIIRFGRQYGYDLARPGIGLYGVDPVEEGQGDLTLVSRLRTVVIAVREYEAGEAIGYGRRGLLKRRSRIATIPIGYADGMNRRFGCGALRVMVNGSEVPTIGNICMDACMLDVTDVACRVGDEVVIFGPEAPVERMADVLGTIPYEVLTGVSPRVKRVYYRD